MEKTNNIFDIVVVGGGPAGLTAAIYGARGGRSVLVLERQSAGGQLSITPDIENYPGVPKMSGYELSEIMKNQATGHGAKFSYATVTKIELKGKIKKITAGAVTYSARSVILCMGAASRKLGLSREEEFTGRGVSYCATCDGAFFRGETVAVNGGGNTAVEDALYLSEIAGKVYLIHRRDKFRASPSLTARLQNRADIEVILESTVTGLSGEKALTGIEVQNTASGEKTALPVSALFVAVGRVPSTEILEGQIKLTPDGYIKTKSDMSTNLKGVFAAGDITAKHLRQVVTAAADGAVAAEAASSYLSSVGL